MRGAPTRTGTVTAAAGRASRGGMARTRQSLLLALDRFGSLALPLAQGALANVKVQLAVVVEPELA